MFSPGLVKCLVFQSAAAAPAEGKPRATMSSSLQSTFQQALGLHQKGALSEAQALYRQVLAEDAGHFDSLHLLGLTLVQGGALEEGAATIARAIALRDDFAEAHYNLGNALLSLARPSDALASLDRAVALNPSDAQYRLEQGNALKELGRLAEALESYRAAVRLAPRLAEAFNNEGVVLKELGRPAEALASYDRAIALRPGYADAYCNCGNALRELGRLEEALISYDKAIALKPRHVEAHGNRGIALAALGRHADALESYDRALALRPANAEALNNRGNALQELGRFAEALASFDAALALRPDYAECWRHRGATLEELGRFEDALASYAGAIAVKPDYAEAYHSRSALLHDMGRLVDARDNIERALALVPDKPAFKANKGRLLLLAGDFANGLPLYEFRKSRRAAKRWTARADAAADDHVDLCCKCLLLHAEQGLGDTIHFARYVRCFVERGAHVLFAPQKPLRRLLRSLDAPFELVDAAGPAVAADLEIPLLSAMHVLGTTLESIPARTPYLAPEPAVVARWQAQLQRQPGETIIGICWQGGTSAIDRGRSFPLRLFHALSLMPGVRLVSLHRGEGEAQLRDMPPGMRVETLGPDFDAGPDAFIDTAAVISLCDLVVTSDTSIAHLAGALGAETWLALKLVPEWRWQMDRRDSPWYPSVTLFRQQVDGDWNGVFRDIGRALQDRLSKRREQ